jgi:type I restriction enzyme S subunit
MNAERLLAHFERISEAPDAIARLRRFILDLAVRGKLVEQDPEDEPVEDLLQRIAVEKTSRRSVRARSTPDERVEGWCSIPASWNFVRLDKVCTVIMGSSPPGSTYNKNGDGVPLINGPVEFTPGPFGRTTINQYTTDPSAFCEEGDFLVCVRGSTTGRTNIAAFRACIGRGIAAIQPLFEDKFIRLAIRVRQEAILQMGRGIAFPSISREQLSGLPVPLPPLAEQHRIVAKVDELMTLCDQLEVARQQAEQGRERLMAATLQRLNQPAEDPASFRKDASFALQVLPSLTTTPTQIKQLRQTILNLAVRGKLVEQDPEDEPAEELVERILSHPWLKKRAKPQPAFADKAKTVMRIPVPDSWTWTTIESLLPPNETVTYGILKPVWVESGVPTVRVTEMKTGAIDVDRLPRCDQSRADKFQKTTLKEGDLLISKDGTIGKTAFVPAALTGGNITQHVLRLPLSSLLSKEYIRFSIDSPWCQTYMSGETKGVALQGVNVGDFRKMPIPLPPLAEQHRIVAKVDELMALCDQLEQQLNQADQQRRRLLDAVLAEALGGRLTVEEESHANVA